MGAVRWLVLLFATWLCLGCANSGAGVGLLGGRDPLGRTPNAERLTDGVLGRRADAWDSDVAVVLTPGKSVEWDLGEVRAIGSAHLQGDQNDEYVISVSEDGRSYRELWRAPIVPGRGLVLRTANDLNGRGRFVRLSTGRGDSRFGVSELALFEEASAPADSVFRVKGGLPASERQRSGILHFGLALVLFVLIAQAKRPWLSLAALLLPAIAGYGLLSALANGWPPGQQEISMVRAMAALVALAALARETFAPERFAASRPAVIGTLGVSAALALAAFFNLGNPQFWDAKNARPGVVHNHDMRVYYPVSKYFRELSFDGVYLASVAAYVDDVPGATLESIGNTQLRDLRTHEMRRVSEVAHEVDAVRTRFSPERWQAFVKDMRWFRETMGDRLYLDSMTDHGGNATPVWIAIAHLIFAKTQASSGTLIATALLDPLLLLIAFVAIGRTFGLRTMLVSMVVFGANDFYMFGSNWAGATLRHDWMAYLALGACALATRRWAIGGALLALSALIRAFPAFALVGLTLPALWWLVTQWRARKRLPTLGEIRNEQRPVLLAAAGAIACVIGFVLFSSLLFSFDAWGAWLHKVSLLDRDPHVNHISLRGLVAGNDGAHLTTLRARMPLFVTLAAAATLAVIAAARGKDLARAALLGTLLIPVAFNPANYYIHFVFVLPLLAYEMKGQRLSARDFAIYAILLGICVLQYWTVLAPGWELHFQLATVLLFAGVAALLTTVLATADAAVPLVEPSPVVEPASAPDFSPAPSEVGSGS